VAAIQAGVLERPRWGFYRLPAVPFNGQGSSLSGWALSKFLTLNRPRNPGTCWELTRRISWCAVSACALTSFAVPGDSRPGLRGRIQRMARYPYDQLGSIGFAIYQGLPSHTRHNQQSKANLPRLSKPRCILGNRVHRGGLRHQALLLLRRSE